MARRTKFRSGDRAWVNARAPLGYSEREGTVLDRAPGRGGYRVRFDDGAVYPDGRPYPSEGYLDSGWLEPAATAAIRVAWVPEPPPNRVECEDRIRKVLDEDARRGQHGRLLVQLKRQDARRWRCEVVYDDKNAPVAWAIEPVEKALIGCGLTE